jgi:hypothetical protein
MIAALVVPCEKEIQREIPVTFIILFHVEALPLHSDHSHACFVRTPKMDICLGTAAIVSFTQVEIF